MSGGWTPSLHLWSHSKGGSKWSPELSAYVPDEANENAICVGACNGDFGIAEALSAGNKAGGGRKSFAVTEPEFGTGEVFNSLPNYIAESKQKSFVDFQNDVTEKDIKLAVRD